MSRSASLNRIPAFGLARPVRAYFKTGALLIALPAETALFGLNVSRRALLAVLPAGRGHRRGNCVDCRTPVTESDPFIRYRGEYYHAHGCAEFDPPALRHRKVHVP